MSQLTRDFSLNVFLYTTTKIENLLHLSQSIFDKQSTRAKYFLNASLRIGPVHLKFKLGNQDSVGMKTVRPVKCLLLLINRKGS